MGIQYGDMWFSIMLQIFTDISHTPDSMDAGRNKRWWGLPRDLSWVLSTSDQANVVESNYFLQVQRLQMEETTIQQNTYCTFTKKVVIELKIGVRMLDRGISQHSPGRGLNLSRAFHAIWHTEYTLVKLDKQQSLKNKYIYIYIDGRFSDSPHPTE